MEDLEKIRMAEEEMKLKNFEEQKNNVDLNDEGQEEKNEEQEDKRPLTLSKHKTAPILLCMSYLFYY